VDGNGKGCQAYRTKDSLYCFRHNPLNKEIALMASRKGGENRKLQSSYGEEVNIQNPSEVKDFIAKVINSVWTGKVPVQVGTAMGFLTRCWLDAYETINIEKRITDIENILCKT